VPWGRWAAGRAGGRRGRRWVAIAAPGRVVLPSAAAGLPGRRRRGWDHTSIPRPEVGCFPGGRAHRAAIGRGGEGERDGRQDSAGEAGSSVNLAERGARGDQDRERACVVLGDVDWGLGRSPGRWPMPVPAPDLMRRYVLGVGVPDSTMGLAPGLDEVLTPLQPGSRLPIWDTGASTALSCPVVGGCPVGGAGAPSPGGWRCAEGGTPDPCPRGHPARPGVRVETPSVNPGWLVGCCWQGGWSCPGGANGVAPPAFPGLVIREGTPRSHLQTRSTTSGHTSPPSSSPTSGPSLNWFDTWGAWFRTPAGSASSTGSRTRSRWQSSTRPGSRTRRRHRAELPHWPRSCF
jgi:hypothetical protein